MDEHLRLNSFVDSAMGSAAGDSLSWLSGVPVGDPLERLLPEDGELGTAGRAAVMAAAVAGAAGGGMMAGGEIPFVVTGGTSLPGVGGALVPESCGEGDDLLEEEEDEEELDSDERDAVADTRGPLVAFEVAVRAAARAWGFAEARTLEPAEALRECKLFKYGFGGKRLDAEGGGGSE